MSDLREELRPDTLPDVSEVASFDSTKLKHVETKESNVLPTKEGKCTFFQSRQSEYIPVSFCYKQVTVLKS